ncbi:hypothetical protein [Nostoc sp.]|uniref:hypothetical protein n=1 Tax=Nostoc sp. TaxID=1180 RepID=UPI002FF5DB1B
MFTAICGWSISVPHNFEICYISPTMKNVGEMVKLLQLSLWNQRLAVCQKTAEVDRVCDRVPSTIGDRTLQNLSNFPFLTQRSPADSYNLLSIAEIFVP